MPHSPTVRFEIEGDFATDGAVCVRSAVTPDDLALATTAIERLLADPSPLAIRASDPDDGAFVEDFRNWQRVPEIEHLARTSPLATLAADLTDSSTIRLFHDHMLTKEAGTAQRTPWHQDQPYYNVDGRQCVSVWLPVDPVPRASSLEFVAGSHLGPWYLPRTFLDGAAKWFPEGQLAEFPDIEAELADSTNDRRVISWELEPGDAVFFHFLTVHGAAGFPGSGRRRVLSLRFLGDDMVHAPRPWRTSPPFEGLDAELPAGGPMDHPLFPLLVDRRTA